MTNEAHGSKSGGANVWLAAIAGLAVGFAVGREMGAKSGHGGGSDDEPSKPSAAAIAPGKVYKSEAQFPAGWLKATDLAAVKDLSWDGLSDAQKATVMQGLNERKCECGCPHQSIAICLKEDPHCPRSKMVKQLIELAKSGKGLTDMYAVLDRDNPSRGAPSAAPAAAPPAGAKKVVITAHSPRKGPKHAKVTIVEFSEFQCPFCSRALPTLKQVQEKYGKDVALVFMSQPLPFHNNAMIASQAFMAAHRQGKAWELHDKMFANQQALSQPDLEKYAQEVGLNMARFKKDLEDPKIKEQIKADQDLGNSVGANGTPTFFINGRELVGAQPFSAFQTIIDDELKKVDELMKKGVKLEDVYTKRMEEAAAAPPPAAPEAAAAPSKVDIAVGDAPTKGPKNAPVTIVAFSEFQCPFCSRVLPTIKQVEDTYKGKVRVAFKHLPLPFHNNAQMAAEASMAAHEQGKFWELHDKMFANQQQLDRPSLEKYAQELGINMGKFKAALDSGKYKSKVEEDAKLASSVGASGTPTFFINGRKVEGAQPFDSFKSVIDEELAKKSP